MSENTITITLKGDYVKVLREIRRKTGLPISQMVSLVLRGYTIIDINTNRDLLKDLRQKMIKN